MTKLFMISAAKTPMYLLELTVQDSLALMERHIKRV